MTGELLARLRGVFVEPSAAAARRVAVADPALPPAVGLLCRPGDALPLGSAVALSLQPGARAALVALWRPEPRAPAGSPELRAPANRHARRLAASLAGRGLDATASGRLARASVPAPPAEAAVAAERALAAAQVPAVLVVAGPRCGPLDEVLASLDLLLVAAAPGEDASLAQLAAAGLARLGPPAELAPALSSPLLRALAATGLLAAPTLRTPLRALLDG